MKKNKKILIVSSSLGALTVSVVIVCVIIFSKPRIPDFSGQNPDQIRGYFESENFRNLDPNSRREQARNIMRQVITKNAREYCELPQGQRTAYLDKIIDETQARRQEFESRRREFEKMDRERPRRRPTQERRRERSESLDPTTRAQMTKLRNAMRARMRQRGMNFRPPPR